MLKQVKHLVDAGFALHWLRPRSKKPIGNDWSNKPVPSVADLEKSYVQGNNVGVRLGKWSRVGGLYLHIIDVDIRVGDLKAQAFEKLTSMLPELNLDTAPVVISGSGGESRHFYLLSDKPFPPRKFAHSTSFQMVWDSDRGKDVKKWDWELHLLGTGSQAVIPPSIHPETGNPYHWQQEFDPFDLEFGAIRPVPASALDRLIGYEDAGEVNPERLKPIGLSIPEIREYLDDLPFEAWIEDRDGWFRTGMAIHHETGGSDEGFDLWCEYSKKSEKFDLRDSKRVWKSFKNRRERPFRMASIVAVVKDERLDRDFEDYGEEFDDLGEEEADAPAEKPDMFDDILGDPDSKRKREIARAEREKNRQSRSQQKLAKEKTETALGKETPGWVKRLNKRHAIARVSGKTVVMDFTYDNRVTYGNVSDLHNFYENDRRPKEDTTVPVTKLWMQHSQRRSYPNGIVFLPNQEIDGAFNHWQGWSVEPDSAKSCKLFLRHIREVWCGDDQNLFRYTMGWMAHLVQRPEEKPGVAVVVKGRKGIGKDTPIEYLGLLFRNHYVTIANKEQMLGKFNQHQERCLLLHMQEGFWAGDKAGESQLKYLITSPVQQIEPKGMNSFPIQSVLRLFISSNERWVVPATDDERRFFVLNASERRRGDYDYFAALRDEMNGGGPAALLDYLLKIDLSNFEIRAVPDTAALGEQKLEGLKNVERWWYQLLQEGFIEGTQRSDDGITTNFWLKNAVQIEKTELRENYARWLRTRRYDGEEVGEVDFSKRLRHLLPEITVTRPRSSAGRMQMYVVPPLQDARTSFEDAIGSIVDWPEDQPVVENVDGDDLG